MDQTEILEIVAPYLQGVRGSGPDNIVAKCPFHADNDPSFAMNIRNGLYICYACDARGNLAKFLEGMGMNPLDVKRRYRRVLERASKAKSTPFNPVKPNVVMEVNRRIPEDLLGLFNRTPAGLLEEGFSEETLKHFRIGEDTLHERTTYPLRDLEGNLVGISGRAWSNDVDPRYKVYRTEYENWDLPIHETDKSLLLWNAHKVYPTVFRGHETQTVVVVEGFKACMWVHQAGFPLVVALMTKTMSDAQKFILERMGARYILMLDNDEAGLAGTISVGTKLLRTSSVKVALYDAPQPTDLSPEEVAEAIEEARDYYDIALHV